MSGPVSSLISRLETLLETRSSRLETLDSKISPRRFSSFESSRSSFE